MNKNLIAARLLYFTYGLIPIAAGFDKFFNYLAPWQIYLNHAVPEAFNTTPETIVHIVGIIEICAGLLVLFKPRIGGTVVAAWLLLISINLVSMGSHTHEGCVQPMAHYDIAVRDIGLAVGAFVLSLLS